MARTLIVFALGVLVGAVLWPHGWGTGPHPGPGALEAVSRTVGQLLHGAADLVSPGPDRP